MIKKTCEVCGNIFEVYPYRIDTAKTCSFKCARIITKKQITLKCAECGKYFNVHPSKNANGRRRFCSVECRDKGITGSKSPRYKSGTTKSLAGYEKYTSGPHKGKYVHRTIWENYFGEIPDGFVIHHINGAKTDNRIENLKLISNPEHALMHGNGFDTRFKKGCKAWMIREEKKISTIAF